MFDDPVFSTSKSAPDSGYSGSTNKSTTSSLAPLFSAKQSKSPSKKKPTDLSDILSKIDGKVVIVTPKMIGEHS